MPKTVRVEHTFNVPWEQTTTAFWCKYPNPELSHVKDALVLDRFIGDDWNLHTTRVIHIEQAVPSLLRKFTNGLDDFFAVETSLVDPKTKSMKLETRNITFGSLVDAVEHCEYKASHDGKSTIYCWSLTVSCKVHIPLLTPQIESTLVNQAKVNSVKGLKAMENLSHEIYSFTRETARKAHDSSMLISKWPSLTNVSAFSAEDSSIDKRSKLGYRFATANLLSCSLFK